MNKKDLSVDDATKNTQDRQQWRNIEENENSSTPS